MNSPANPHAFPSLLDSKVQTFSVIGTGLSRPNGPTADDLRDKEVDRATARLALPQPDPPPTDKEAFDLYVWAGQALDQLRERDWQKTPQDWNWRRR